MIRSALIVTLTLLLASCSGKDRREVNYSEESTEAIPDVVMDSTTKEIASLPVVIDSIDCLLHPIGSYRMRSGRGKLFKSENYGTYDFATFGRRGISGEMFNIKFEHKVTGDVSSLTEDYMIIRNIEFMSDIFEQSKRKIFLYKVTDTDSDRDGELNYNDITSLYFSWQDGSGYTKLTEPYHDLLGWEEVAVKERVYFKTMEDSNRNGDFDPEDNLHYYYVDFTSEIPVVKEYNPMKDEF